MKSFKELITENVEEFKDFKDGVLSARYIGGTPDPERLKNKAFHGGFQMGITHGKKNALSKFRLWRKSGRKSLVKWGADKK